MTSRARTAIVQDWFFRPGGSEQVAIELAGLLYDPDVHTSFADRASREEIGPRLHPWPLQRVFGATRRYRSFLPLYPIWFGALDLRACDLVISSSSAFAKAVRTRPDATHIGYIHTPMRYAWDLSGYMAGSSLSLPSRVAAHTIRPLLQRWDRSTSRRPDVLVANSVAVRERIRRYWNRDAEVIHPPVDVGEIGVSNQDDEFLLVVARLLAYRRVELAIEAARRLGRRLVIVGDGPERAHLEAMSAPTVRFTGTLSRPDVLDLFARCHAYIVPGEEDFGIAPVEAMAAGKPVIAFRAGGAVETVVEDQTGVFFDQQTPEAVAVAIRRLDAMTFDPAAIRANAERFSPSVFRGRFTDLLRRLGIDRALYRSESPSASGEAPAARSR